MAATPDLSSVPLQLTRPVHAYYQYQGDKTNDCGPTSVAIAVNTLLGKSVREGSVVAGGMTSVDFE